MKITVSEAQARRLRGRIGQDPHLADVGRQLEKGLDQAARNPMLTAHELAALVRAVDDTLAVAVPDNVTRDLLKQALPKLKAMAKKAGQVAAANSRG